MRIVNAWKGWVAQAEVELVRFGSWFVLLDVITGFVASVVPFLATPFTIARVGALTILVPAVFRTLAMRHATRPDADFLKAIAIAILVVAVYVAVRTSLVVEVCSG
jgi:phosphate starvation-inducible membrane PsiE